MNLGAVGAHHDHPVRRRLPLASWQEPEVSPKGGPGLMELEDWGDTGGSGGGGGRRMKRPLRAERKERQGLPRSLNIFVFLFFKDSLAI